MAKSISCNCGWHEHGTEKELVEAFVQHAQEGHGFYTEEGDCDGYSSCARRRNRGKPCHGND